MSDAPLSWTGLTPEELAARMEANPFAAQREPLMQRITLTALRHAQQRAPVKTGTLRRSLINWVEPGGLRGYIGSNLEYSIFVHEGTRFMAARPFLEEGIEDSRDEIAQLLQAAGDEYFKSIV
jgi:hypothetical protein